MTPCTTRPDEAAPATDLNWTPPGQTPQGGGTLVMLADRTRCHDQTGSCPVRARTDPNERWYPGPMATIFASLIEGRRSSDVSQPPGMQRWHEDDREGSH